LYRRWRVLVIAGPILGVGGALGAQTPGAASTDSVVARQRAQAVEDSIRAARDSMTLAARCRGERIRDIVIVPQPPTVITTRGAVTRFLLKVALQQATTHEHVVRAFLQFGVGDACSPQALAETQRILRAQPFIADAKVIVVPDSANSVAVQVETVDEIPPVIGGSISRNGLNSLTLGNANLAGEGLYMAGNWMRGGFYRDGFGGQFNHYHMFGEPFILSISGQRRPLGGDLALSLGHPWITDLQRTGFDIGYRRSTDYVGFRRDGTDPSLSIDRRDWDVGAVGRLGLLAKRVMAGVLVTHEAVNPAASGVMITNEGLIPDSTGALNGRYAPFENDRVNLVLGVRLLDFVRVSGFDALEASQDLARGLQLWTRVGRSVPWFGATDRDDFAAMDLYSGAGSESWFTGMRLQGEVRRDRDTGRWDGLVTSGRLAWYFKSGFSRTLVLAGEFSGAWRERIPFQLTFADPSGGLRGFGWSTAAGGQRLVARAEHRWLRGRATSHAAWGFAAFADAGKLWAGDVPFGTTTGVNASVGAGLLLAIPSQSQQLLRLDVATPVTPNGGSHWEVRFTAQNLARAFWREPGDIARVRAAAPSSAIFATP